LFSLCLLHRSWEKTDIKVSNFVLLVFHFLLTFSAQSSYGSWTQSVFSKSWTWIFQASSQAMRVQLTRHPKLQVSTCLALIAGQEVIVTVLVDEIIKYEML
jgi:hypothetical protein